MMQKYWQQKERHSENSTGLPCSRQTNRVGNESFCKTQIKKRLENVTFLCFHLFFLHVPTIICFYRFNFKQTDNILFWSLVMLYDPYTTTPWLLPAPMTAIANYCHNSSIHTDLFLNNNE